MTDPVQFGIEDPSSVDAQWCFEQYFAELNARFQAGFNPSLSISADASELIRPAGLLVIARRGGQVIGCGALKFHEGAPAELKRMWVAPEARGIGLGRRLLEELERLAREAGVQVLHLETNGSLHAAIQLYRSAGFKEVAAFNNEPYADYWFEKRLGKRRLRRGAGSTG